MQVQSLNTSTMASTSTPGAETTAPPSEDVTTQPKPRQFIQRTPRTQADTKGLEATPPNKESFIPIKTTLPIFPLPSGATGGTITTPRLLLRVPTQDDLQAFHDIRTDPEIMIWTVQGRIDKDLAETQAKLDTFLPPNDTFKSNWAICDRETGEMIGLGGIHNFSSSFGWPEVGYMLRRDYWGKGLATEFLRGFCGYWGGLEREEREILVDARTVDGVVVEEMVIAITSEYNGGSHGVLRKSGFEEFLRWEALDDRLVVPEMIWLPTFRWFPRRGKEVAE